MSISDELAKLNELHQSGALTSEEYSGAKTKLLGGNTPGNPTTTPDPTSAFRKGGNQSTPKRSSSNPARLVLLIALLAVVLWVVMRKSSPKEVAANPLLSAVASLQPIDLRDEVQNLPANSIKWVPLTLPYSGTLHLEVQVIRGNPLDIRLVDPSEIESIKAKKPFRHYPEFEAEKTATYRRDGRLQSGTYMLIITDQSLGILSASASDVHVKARIQP